MRRWFCIFQGIRWRMLLIFFFTCSILAACDSQHTAEPKKKKEMLVYCGVTMIKPMLEIARMIENQENVKIVITKGGSGNLMKSLLYSKTGDLYLPGSDKYLQILDQEHPGLIEERVFVGHNKAAIMVQKGNPLGITSDLNDIAKDEFAVVIGNPESGSIGQETKIILDKKGLYDAVLGNTMKLTTDSKDLVRLLISKEADIVINWYAVSTWEENKDFMDVIEIDPQIAKKKNLILGLLRFSQNKPAARKFMELASSPRGKAIFKKHGLYFE